MVRGWDVSLRALNRKKSSLGGERWLREEERKGIGGGEGLTTTMTGKDRREDRGNHSKFSCLVNISKLRLNLDANPFEVGKSFEVEKVTSVHEDVGLELIEEKKRKRVYLDSDGVGHSEQDRSSCMEIDKNREVWREGRLWDVIDDIANQVEDFRKLFFAVLG